MTPKKKTEKSPTDGTQAAAKPAKAAAKKPAKTAAPAGDGALSLVIVESPAKEKTISKFLGKGYLVKSSYGHVRDLPARELGVDEKTFEPSYEPLPRTKKILPELKKAASAAGTIFLATDHDREGESIAWHLAFLLDPKHGKIRRITFHEITPGAIKEAIANPRDLDMRLVQAQQARRVLDRLVGYKLSPLLWRKIKKGLSAGRVQSVAVRLVVERQKEIDAFKSEPYWTLEAKFLKEGAPPPFAARLSAWKGQRVETSTTHKLFAEEYKVRSSVFPTKEALEEAVSVLRAGPFKVAKVERKEVSRRPAPPHTTSTMQQQSSRVLGFAAERTMRTAQSLYEGVPLGKEGTVGLITYMRTDSVNVAKVAQEEAAGFIKQRFGAAYAPAQPPVYQTRSKSAQEAHEAIRPTSVQRTPEQMRDFLSPEQYKLYALVWKRFVASQMAEARFDQVGIDIAGGPGGEGTFRAGGRTVKFDGWLKVYEKPEADETPEKEPVKEGEEEEGRIPTVEEGDVLSLQDLALEDHATSAPPNYNEASLIRAMEAHGIGRPSTYAPTIQTILARAYCRAEGRERRLSPTDLGTLVTEKLTAHFPEVIDLPYTATIEEHLDEIAEGALAWDKVVKEFYGDFAKDLAAAGKEMKEAKVEPKPTDEKCPLCGKPMVMRESRFGRYLSCTGFPECKGKVNLSASGEKIVPQATDEKCEKCGKPMVIRMGRRGRFMACTGYPDCRNTFSVDAEGRKIIGTAPVVTNLKCEKSGHAMLLRTGKRGYFLTCSGFPKCRNLRPVSKDEGERLKAEAPKQ